AIAGRAWPAWAPRKKSVKRPDPTADGLWPSRDVDVSWPTERTIRRDVPNDKAAAFAGVQRRAANRDRARRGGNDILEGLVRGRRGRDRGPSHAIDGRPSDR